MASTTVEIHLNGKKYVGKLSVQAVEQVEAQFNNDGILRLVDKLSLRVCKAILVASITSETPALKAQDVSADCDAEYENGGGLNGLLEPATALVKASGLIRDRTSGKS